MKLQPVSPNRELWSKSRMLLRAFFLDSSERLFPSPSNLTWKIPLHLISLHFGFPDGLVGKESTCKAGEPGFIPRWGRSPGEGNGNPLQYSCLGNSMERGVWWVVVHRVSTQLITYFIFICFQF